MAMKSVSSLILTALISAPLSGYATQYPLTVTDLDGRSITLQHEPGNDSNLLIVFYVQIMPDDFVMQLHRF